MPRQGQSSQSTIYVKVDALCKGKQDLTGDTCRVAFTHIGTLSPPLSGEWYAGLIVPGNTIRILSGPQGGAVVLAQGRYEVWVDILDNPERPVAPVGTWTVGP